MSQNVERWYPRVLVHDQGVEDRRSGGWLSLTVGGSEFFHHALHLVMIQVQGLTQLAGQQVRVGQVLDLLRHGQCGRKIDAAPDRSVVAEQAGVSTIQRGQYMLRKALGAECGVWCASDVFASA